MPLLWAQNRSTSKKKLNIIQTGVTSLTSNMGTAVYEIIAALRISPPGWQAVTSVLVSIHVLVLEAVT